MRRPHGTVPATVTTMCADAANDKKLGAILPVALKLATAASKVDGRQVRLSPGMNLTAEVKTGRRRVIDFLLSPIQRTANESVRER